jgi:hypothetical protein
MDQDPLKPTHFYAYIGNKYKIRSLLIAIVALFIFLLIILVTCYSLTCPLLNFGGALLMDLTKIAFIILVTPFAIVTLFIGYRIDERGNIMRYPLWVELTGLIFGIFFGWAISVEWAFLLTISQGLIWANPFLYTPFAFITPLITYLCFKGAQFIYSINKKDVYKQSFFIPLVFFVFALPVLIYSALALFSLMRQEASQTSITLTNFKQTPKNLGYVLTGDVTVPEDYLYHITASVGTSPHLTSVLALRLNGVANIDGLYNFELTKGINTLSFTPSQTDCSYSSNTTSTKTVTFYISKVLADRLTIATPLTITETIMCAKKPGN